MKKIQIAIMAGALCLAVQAHASLYDISFSATDGSGVSASGVLTVSGGVATGGTLDVTGGPNPGTFTLLAESAPPGGFLFDPGTPPHASFDNLVTPGSNPFLNNSSIYGGLVWENATDTVGYKMFFNTPDYAQLLNQDYGVPDAPNVYALWGWQSPGAYGPQSFGAANLTPVPEASTFIAGALLLLPFGINALRSFRKQAA